MAALVLLEAATVAGCATQAPSADGPLKMPEELGVVCAPLPDYEDVALGVNLPTDLPSGLVIKGVEPVAPQDVTIVGVYLMPVSEDSRLLLDHFPPTSQFPGAWPSAFEAIGAEVPTDTAVDLVVEARATGAEASLDGLRIMYSVDGASFVAESHVGLDLRSSGCD